MAMNHHAAGKARLLRALGGEPERPIVRWGRKGRLLKPLGAFVVGLAVGTAPGIALAHALFGAYL